MDEFEKIKHVERIAIALERIADALEILGSEGMTIYNGPTSEEN